MIKKKKRKKRKRDNVEDDKFLDEYKIPQPARKKRKI